MPPGLPPRCGRLEHPGGRTLEQLDDFLPYAQGCLKHPSERARLETILTLWTAKWTGKKRVLDFSRSLHGAYLHFNQFMDGKWVQAFTFVATRREGVCLRGPDVDRARKSHKYRHNPLDSAPWTPCSRPGPCTWRPAPRAMRWSSSWKRPRTRPGPPAWPRPSSTWAPKGCRTARIPAKLLEPPCPPPAASSSLAFAPRVRG